MIINLDLNLKYIFNKNIEKKKKEIKIALNCIRNINFQFRQSQKWIYKILWRQRGHWKVIFNNMEYWNTVTEWFNELFQKKTQEGWGYMFLRTPTSTPSEVLDLSQFALRNSAILLSQLLVQYKVLLLIDWISFLRFYLPFFLDVEFLLLSFFSGFYPIQERWNETCFNFLFPFLCFCSYCTYFSEDYVTSSVYFFYVFC